MELRAGELREEHFAESHLKHEQAYRTVFNGANTCSPVRRIKLDGSGAES